MHIKRIHEMEEKLTEIALCEINKGIECVNTAEMGAVIDMIKDLACAEKEAREAKEMEKEEEDEKKENEYFLKMLKEEYGEEEGEKRFYDNYRYKSSGRFAPKGRGSYMPRIGRRGYEEPPYYHMTPEMMREHDPEYWRDVDRKEGRMYYTPMSDVNMSRNAADARTSVSGGNVRGYSDGYADGYSEGERMGKTKGGTSRYDKAKRGYEETKEMHKGNTPQEKQEKMKSLENYMKELAEDVTDMISDATPEERNLLKQKMQVMIQKIS